jgi:hypothetical protein
MSWEPFDLEKLVDQISPNPEGSGLSAGSEAVPVNPLQKANELAREAMEAYVARDNNRTSLAILSTPSHLNDMPGLGVSDEERLTLGQTQGAKEFADFIKNVANDPKHYPGDDPIVL